MADGLAEGQWVEYVGAGSRESLREELAGVDDFAGWQASTGIDVNPVAEFYEFEPSRDIVDPEASVAKRVRATEDAIEAGYTGFRAVVDATAVARSPEQRRAFARFEYLIDRVMARHPVSALCAYSATEIGDAAGELVCLHPYVNAGSVPFQLYADREADFALSGSLDLASEELLTTTLARTTDLVDGSAVVEGGGIEFVGHRALLSLAEIAAEREVTVTLRRVPHMTGRLVDLLEVPNMRVEQGHDPGKTGEHGSYAGRVVS